MYWDNCYTWLWTFIAHFTFNKDCNDIPVPKYNYRNYSIIVDPEKKQRNIADIVNDMVSLNHHIITMIHRTKRMTKLWMTSITKKTGQTAADCTVKFLKQKIKYYSALVPRVFNCLYEYQRYSVLVSKRIDSNQHNLLTLLLL